MLFRYRTTCCLLYQRASLLYQQRCTACFTERQRDLSILMPLRQSVCTPYSQRLQVRIKQYVSKTIRFCSSPRNAYFLPVCANLPPSLISSLLFLIQPLDLICCKILLLLNIMMTEDSLFLSKSDFELSTTFRSQDMTIRYPV